MLLYYNSMTSRMPIVHALTGKACRDPHGEICRIGTSDEESYFAVIMGLPDDPKNACKLFFDSPEEYEKITGNVVSSKSKQKFYFYDPVKRSRSSSCSSISSLTECGRFPSPPRWFRDYKSF